MTISKLNEITYSCISTIHSLDECLWKISIRLKENVFTVNIHFLDGLFDISYLNDLAIKLSVQLDAAVINISFNAVNSCFSYIFIDKTDI